MCIFCEIVAGNIPGKKVYEDDEVLAILDISQTTKGHTLVMPKKHYATSLDMTEFVVCGKWVERGGVEIFFLCLESFRIFAALK